MTSFEQVMDRVRKLLALATSDNEHEAATAAAAAHRLMQEHQIDEASIAAAGVEEVIVVERGESLTPADRRRAWWKSVLASGVSRANRTQGLWSGTNLRFVGHRSDVQASSYLFQYCAREIDRLARQHRGQGASFINGFRVGAAHTVALRLVEESGRVAEEFRARDAVSADRALAVLDRRLDAIKLFLADAKLKNVKASRAGIHADGYYAGQRAADEIRLSGSNALDRGALGISARGAT